MANRLPYSGYDLTQEKEIEIAAVLASGVLAGTSRTSPSRPGRREIEKSLREAIQAVRAVSDDASDDAHDDSED